MSTQDIVQKLWNLCHVLRDDGVSYHEYVTELTYLLFLKMAEETGIEGELPEGYRWSDLESKDGIEQLQFYRRMLVDLTEANSKKVQAIFNNASTAITKPAVLSKLVTELDKLDWFSARQDGLGDLYEGLLEKNATETKGGAGQYFTPRPLINTMVKLVQPQPGETVQDPAAGTAGFLIAADRYVKDHSDELFDLPEQLQLFQRSRAFHGVELVPDTHRLALMNLMLHDIDADLLLGDTLSTLGEGIPKADIILTNPPFGTKTGGGAPTRTDFTFQTSNKQLAFLQHVYRGLKPGGRAAVVLPDNVLFEENVGRQIRQDLMDKCNLHTILRLPTGIFYAQGVKTNVLFFTRGEAAADNTEAVWFYDLRTNMPSFGKRTPFTEEHVTNFMECYGEDPNGGSDRDEATGLDKESKDKSGDALREHTRWRCYTREEVAARGDNLDVTWIRDESIERAEDLPEPDEIAEEIIARLHNALDDMSALRELLASSGSAAE